MGDLVYGMFGWQEFAVDRLRPPRRAQVLPADLPPVASLGVFGLNGQTAYWGLLDVGRPAAGETVVVSAAAGATGSLVGQLARIAGARVVGLAGSAAKRAWITDELGFDVALDYRAPDLAERFAEACPDGVDVFFDNVGGPVLDLALSRLAMRGRVVLCGAISAYNEAGFGPGPTQYRQLIRQRGRMEGFIVMDYAPRYGEALGEAARVGGRGPAAPPGGGRRRARPGPRRAPPRPARRPPRQADRRRLNPAQDVPARRAALASQR